MGIQREREIEKERGRHTDRQENDIHMHKMYNSTVTKILYLPQCLQTLLTSRRTLLWADGTVKPPFKNKPFMYMSAV